MQMHWSEPMFVTGLAEGEPEVITESVPGNWLAKHQDFHMREGERERGSVKEGEGEKHRKKRD